MSRADRDSDLLVEWFQNKATGTCHFFAACSSGKFVVSSAREAYDFGHEGPIGDFGLQRSTTYERGKQQDRAPQFSSTDLGQSRRFDRRLDVTRRVSPESKQVMPAQTDYGALPRLKRFFADSYGQLEERGDAWREKGVSD